MELILIFQILRVWVNYIPFSIESFDRFKQLVSHLLWVNLLKRKDINSTSHQMLDSFANLFDSMSLKSVTIFLSDFPILGPKLCVEINFDTQNLFEFLWRRFKEGSDFREDSFIAIRKLAVSIISNLLLNQNRFDSDWSRFFFKSFSVFLSHRQFFLNFR